MSFFSKIKQWFFPLPTAAAATVVVEKPVVEKAPPVPVVEEEPVELTEEEQQFAQVKQLIESDDLSNHQLAAMFMQSLNIVWDHEMYQTIAQAADKMTFWIEQDILAFKLYFTKLEITPKFFSQYSEIAEFAAVLPQLESIEELHWKAKHYWNQHPILVAASQLPNLKRLYVEGCRMNFLPDRLVEAKALEELYLSNNKLTEMPVELGQLTRLRILDLSKNEFKRCPRPICNLKKLEVLRLHDNPLNDVEPRLLGRLYRLKDLQLPEVIAKFNLDTFQEWLPDLNFDKPYWKFD